MLVPLSVGSQIHLRPDRLGAMHDMCYEYGILVPCASWDCERREGWNGMASDIQRPLDYTRSAHQDRVLLSYGLHVFRRCTKA